MRETLRDTREKTYYALKNMFPFLAAFIDRSLGFARRCSWTRMSSLYTKVANKIVLVTKTERG